MAFKLICLDKMLSDGYFDMSTYIFGRIRKADMYAKLTSEKSKFSVLYDKSYPKPEKAFEKWNQLINQHSYDETLNMTHTEATAIVNWVYRCLKNSNERVSFTLELFKQIKELHNIKNTIVFSGGVFYNKEKVDVHFFSSISSINKFISSLKCNKDQLFFRGHSNANYILMPSVFRNENLIFNESKMYNELLINCPEDFEKCYTHLEKLVEMQHYGLPTRLLDITKNLLVALYFACETDYESYGEVVLISAKDTDIKYPQSDIVSVLASLPAFSYNKQKEFMDWAENDKISNLEFNKLASRLVHEVRLEKPAFQPDINKADILDSYIVYAAKNNKRIVKQNGAFILCGLGNTNYTQEKFRYKENNKKVVLLISNKKSVMEQLETFSINYASLFPEIDCVANYIKYKYQNRSYN
ncbi:MAG: FRG domain-containing protein [Bacteroidales bacterium]|nr:FRG domain-containing protein [Bacteroidales bacterium]